MLYPHVVSFFSIYFFAGIVTWENLMLTAVEGGHGIFKKPYVGKNMHSVLEGLSLQPM